MKTHCEAEMIRSLNAASVAESLVKAHLHDCVDLKQTCLEWIADKFANFDQEDNWNLLKLYPDLLAELTVFLQRRNRATSAADDSPFFWQTHS